MPFVNPEIIMKLKQMDLLTYLQNYEPGELVPFSAGTYTTKTHDSLKISNGKWMWWSKGIGGRSALDYLIKVRGFSFMDAVERLLEATPICESINVQQEKKELILPRKCNNTIRLEKYLVNRGIDKEIIRYCIQQKLIYESIPYHNVVFVGYDSQGKARYAAFRATREERIMGEHSGSDKRFAFRLTHEASKTVHVFESAIDLLSCATLWKLAGCDWKEEHMLSLGGVAITKDQEDKGGKEEEKKIPIALENLLASYPHIQQIVLHLDNDDKGRSASHRISNQLSASYEVVEDPAPQGKDFNDFLCIQRGIHKGKSREER